MSEFLRDVSYHIRTLGRQPAFAGVVILTLGLGIGGATAIFSFIEGVLLRPLPYPDPDRLMYVCEVNPEMPPDFCGGAPGNMLSWREQSGAFESLGLARRWPFSLKTDDKYRGVNGGVVTTDLFKVFGVRPFLGRLITEGDSDEGRDHVMVLSHQIWKDRFGGDPGAVGRQVDLSGEMYEVAGVLPPDFEIPRLESVQLWIPLWHDRVEWRSWRGLWSFGRLKPEATEARAETELRGVAQRLAREYPDTNADWSVTVIGVHEHIVAPVRTVLLLFLAAVGCVLLIACANTANLFLVRNLQREKELAVRAALGASRWRLIQQLLVESLVYSLLGGAAGSLLALWLVQLFARMTPAGFPRIEQVSVNGAVLLFALGISVGTSLVFGSAPSWQATRLDLNHILREGRGGQGGPGASRLRHLLVVGEVALALVLLVNAGLLIRSFQNLLDWNPGFESRDLVMFSVFPARARYNSAELMSGFYRKIHDELSSLPGVVSVGEASAAPLAGAGDGVQEFYVEGRPMPVNGEFPTVAWFDCGPDYFRTMGIPLKSGRFFTYGDTHGAPLVALINETMARMHFADENPVGQRIHMRDFEKVSNEEVAFEIVGVVGDVQPFDPRERVEPQIFWPLEQQLRGASQYVVRTDVDPVRVVPSLQARLEEVDSELTVGPMLTLRKRVNRQLVEPRFHMMLVGLFSIVALLIALVGVYSVLSYAVSQRTHEFGIRMALGASNTDLMREVLGRGLMLTGTGVLLGLLGAWGATRWVQSLLVEVAPTDPVTFLGTAAVLLIVAGAACFIPARRAMQVDPMVALRYK